MLSECVDNLLLQSRWQNIWILGVKEGMEKGDPTVFVKVYTNSSRRKKNF